MDNYSTPTSNWRWSIAVKSSSFEGFSLLGRDTIG